MRWLRWVAFFLSAATVLYSLLWLPGCQRDTETPRQTLWEGLTHYRKTISFPKGLHAEKEDINTLYSTLLATEPGLYYVDRYYTVGATPLGEVNYVCPRYRYSKEEKEALDIWYQTAVDAILRPARILSTKREQATYLYDHLTTYFSYDTTQENYDTLSLLQEGRGVCQAISLLYKDLCQRLDIPCEVVLCFEMSHQWNRVYIDGVWLSLDAVWDMDTPPLSHTYFLLSPQQLHQKRVEKDPLWQGVSPM